jgi:phosphate transport system substrate-binding protein
MEQGRKRTSVLRIVIFLSIGAVLGVLIYLSPSYFNREEKPDLPHLKTGGTSNVEMILANRWRTVYRKEKEVEVDYASTGSTKGIQQLIDKNVAIAFTHAPLSEETRQKAQAQGGAVLHIPVVLCAVVPAYKVKELEGKPPLRFTGEVLADIYLGKIDRWNHPALKELNKDVELPDTKIVAVHREDSSGTTFIFADYLYGASPAWQKAVGKPQNEIKWPAGVGKPRNTGVADYVAKTEGAIGYVDLLHVFHGELTYGAVENKDRTAFIHAQADNMTAAAKSLSGNIPDDLTFSLTNKSGKDAYPICGAIWAVCYQDQPAAQQKQVVDFLQWVMDKGQPYAANMSYAPLPEELVQRATQQIKTIKATQ